jgi:hypothetical protein
MFSAMRIVNAREVQESQLIWGAWYMRLLTGAEMAGSFVRLEMTSLFLGAGNYKKVRGKKESMLEGLVKNLKAKAVSKHELHIKKPLNAGIVAGFLLDNPVLAGISYAFSKRVGTDYETLVQALSPKTIEMAKKIPELESAILAVNA